MIRGLLAGTLLALSMATSLEAHAAQAGASRLDALRDQVEQAYLARSLDGLEAARVELLALPAEPVFDRAPYLAAFARFRQSMLTGERAAARAYLEDCIAELGRYVASAGEDAEARALLGSCYGISTRYNKLAMATRGMAARAHMAAARLMAPENPFVMLQDGLADYSTPALFGGDRQLGIRKVEQAAALFATAAGEGSRLAAFAVAESWLQLATMYRETGRLAEADRARDNARAVATGGVIRIAGL
jgi:hypothetical protein